MITSYISLEVLALELALPQKYLRDLAEQGELPFLDVNGRRRFSSQAVRESLNELAHKNIKKR